MAPDTPRAWLHRCVGDVDAFAAGVWGRQAHLHSDAALAGLLSVDDVDHLLTASALRRPSFRLVREGRTLDPARYTRRARVGSVDVDDLADPARVLALFTDGATLVLQGLQRFWPAVTALCRELEQHLGHPVQANAYLTPAQAQGLGVHADAHDVFAIQTHGHKQWLVHGDGAERPATRDIELEPGDCLYLPQGMAHAAHTTGSVSLHLTIGVRSVTWRQVLRRAVDAAVTEAGLDGPLPLGFAADADALAADVEGKLAQLTAALGRTDADAAAAAEVVRARSVRPPALEGQLRQLLAADALTDACRLRRRRHLVWTLDRDGDMVELVLSDRTLRLPAAVEPALRTALEATDGVAVADLDGLDPASRLVLARRLVREGVTEIVDG